MTVGNAHARHSDPATSKAASWSDFTKLKQRCLLLFRQYDRNMGLTAAELQMACEYHNVKLRFGPHPLGVSPWRRITDCVEEGWVEAATDPQGELVTRIGYFGKYQQVWQLTAEGRITADALIYRVRQGGAWE